VPRPLEHSLRIATLALLVWVGAGFVRSAGTLPDRGGRAGLAGLEPFLWLRASPEVVALDRFLAGPGAAWPRGTTVLVVADAGPGVEASFLWHWAQYLAPRANFYWSADVPADFAAEWVLAWGPVPPRPEWRESARDGALALYRVAR